jgi:hypothetical protein
MKENNLLTVAKSSNDGLRPNELTDTITYQGKGIMVVENFSAW